MCKFANQKKAMFPKTIKIVLATLSIGYAIYQFIESNIGNGIALIFLSGVFVFLYYKNELILLSFLRLRKQDFDGTLRWLQRIKNPESAGRKVLASRRAKGRKKLSVSSEVRHKK